MKNGLTDSVARGPVLGLLMLAALLSGCGTTRGTAGDRLLMAREREGAAAFAAGNDEAAREAYRRAYERASRLDDAAGRVRAGQALAVCHLALGEADRAVNYAGLAAADALDAGLSGEAAMELLAKSLLAADRADEALQVMEELAPTPARGVLQAEILLRLDRADEARQVLDAAWPTKPAPRQAAGFWRVRGELLSVDGDWAEASLAMEQAALSAQQAAPARAAGMSLYAQAALLARRQGDRARSARLAWEAARLAQGVGRQDRALAWGREALDDAAASGDEVLLGRLTSWMDLMLPRDVAPQTEEEQP